MTDITDDERSWFKAHPSRSYRCRLATHDEIEGLRDAGMFDGKRLAPGCFLFALFKIDRQRTTLEGRIVVLEAGPTWDEASCRKAWFDCEQAERVMQ